MSYYYAQLNDSNGNLNPDVIQRLPDYAFIPNSMSNRDWVAYQDWLAQGNVPFPPGDFYEYVKDGSGNIRSDAVQEFRDNVLIDNTMSPGVWDNYVAWANAGIAAGWAPLPVGFMG
jgi:hypothetical protein